MSETELPTTPEVRPETFRDTVLPGAIVAGGVGLIYSVAFPHRADYTGHFVAGFGATLLVLCVVSLFTHDDKVLLAAVVVSVAAGIVAERTVFRLAIADPVDIGNQTVGAALAGCTMWNRQQSRRLTFALAALGAAMTLWGFIVANH